MPKKKRSTQEKRYWDRLPDDLETRLQAVWSQLGYLVDWCDDADSWTDMFCSEARPYRETFYWESVATMVSDYLQAHPEASPDLALADCLIATQSSATSDDSNRLTHFRTAWSQILGHSTKRVEAFIKADLELAERNGRHEIVAGLHAADQQNSKNRTDRSG